MCVRKCKLGFLFYDRHFSFSTNVTLKEKARFGFYYYVNNHEFIYEYLAFIQKQYYEDDFSLIYQTFYFIRNYFGVLGKVERENISGLVLNNHGEYIEPTKQPSLIDFKHKGCGK